MDAQQRLTRIDEWEVGASYHWLKGGQPGKIVTCVSVDADGGVHLREEESGTVFRSSSCQWRNRWVVVK